jgi:hypothetical protein
VGSRVSDVLIRFLSLRMGEAKENDVYEEELLDYEEDDDKTVDGSAAKPTGEVAKKYACCFSYSAFFLLGWNLEDSILIGRNAAPI